MTEHLSPYQVEDYCLQRLAPRDLLAVDDHLAECADCRLSVQSLLTISPMSLYADLAEETSGHAHLSVEQTDAYVDGLLTGDERKMIEDHLSSCARCAPEVADLGAFRNAIASELDHEYQPATSVPVANLTLKRDQSAQGLSRINIPRWSYGVAAALLLLAVVVWMNWRSRLGTGTQQIAVVTPTLAPSPSVKMATPAPSIAVAPVMVRVVDGPSSLTLDASGVLTGAEGWPLEYQELARHALTSRRVEKSPELAGLSRPRGSLMSSDGQPASFAVIEPSGRIIPSDRPTFRWSKLSGATGYIVEVYDERFTLVTESSSVTGDNWTSPPLQRGQVFSWQVKAIKEGGEVILAPRPPESQAKFRILDKAKADEIARVRRDYPSRLLLGLVYARAGLVEEAERELGGLKKANPDVEVVNRLLANLRAR